MDTFILAPHAPAVTGLKAIKEFFVEFPETTNFKIEALEVDGSDDHAWVYGTYSMTLSPPGASPVDDVGKYIEVWKKQPDGVWKVTHDIFNSDLPWARESRGGGGRPRQTSAAALPSPRACWR